MDGPEISVDAIVHQGRVTICGAADRHIGFAPYFVELGHTMPSALPTSLLRRAADVFRRGVAALGIDNGAAKGDIKLTSSGPMIGEIAARLSGGFMSGWTYPYASGVEVTQAALNLAVGLPPGPLEPMAHRVSAERALISIPGEIDDIVGCEDAVSVRDTRDLFLLSERGDRVQMPTNNVEKCGNVITCADTREEAVTAADTAVGRVLFRLVPGHPDTESFLRRRPSEACGHGPNAYSLENAANLAALSAMPERITGSGGPDILELPCIEAELEKDWTHLRLKEAVDRIAAMTGARFVDRPTARRACLGRVFWRALLRGGVQAGVYVIDTERSENSRSERSRQDYAVTARARSGGA